MSHTLFCFSSPLPSSSPSHTRARARVLMRCWKGSTRFPPCVFLLDCLEVGCLALPRLHTPSHTLSSSSLSLSCYQQLRNTKKQIFQLHLIYFMETFIRETENLFVSSSVLSKSSRCLFLPLWWWVATLLMNVCDALLPLQPISCCDTDMVILFYSNQ